VVCEIVSHVRVKKISVCSTVGTERLNVCVSMFVLCVWWNVVFVRLSVCGMGPGLPVNSSSLWTQEVCWGVGGDVRVIFCQRLQTGGKEAN